MTLTITGFISSNASIYFSSSGTSAFVPQPLPADATDTGTAANYINNPLQYFNVGMLAPAGAVTNIYFEPEPDSAYYRRLIKERKAERKARRLFYLLFGEEGFLQIARKGYLELQGASGARYRIGLRFGMDVRKDDEDFGLCSMIDEGVPCWDRLIAFGLLLRAGAPGEQELLQRANKRSLFNLGAAA